MKTLTQQKVESMPAHMQPHLQKYIVMAEKLKAYTREKKRKK